jgi:hypothetical protein
VEVSKLIAQKENGCNKKQKLGYGPNNNQIVATLSKPLQL